MMEESLQLLASCSICLEVLPKQKQLSCQHAVCLDCLQQLTTGRKKAPCPVCKKVIIVPNGGVQKLPDCLLIKQLVDLVTPLTADSSSPNVEDTDDKAQMSASGTKSKSGQRSRGKGKRVDKGKSPTHSHTVKQQDEKMRRKVERLQMALKREMAETNAQVAKIQADRQRVEGTINEAISEIKRTCEVKLTSLESSKTVHCGEIDAKLDTCAAKLKQCVEIQKDLGVHSKAQTKDDKARIAELGNKFVSVLSNQQVQRGGEAFEEGDRVRILPTATNTTLSELLCGEVNFTSVGIFIKKMEERRSYHERDGAPCQDKVWVMFPEKINWVGDVKQLVHTTERVSLPYKGDKVQVIDEKRKRPAFLLNVKSDSSYSVESEKDVKAVIRYANSSTEERVPYTDITFFIKHQFKVGDKVRVDSTIEIPSRGWGDINGSSVGQIKSLSEMQQTGKMEVVVEFEEDKDWSGILDDIELSSTPSVGDQVQVKLSVSEPYLKWGGVTHADRGTLKKITNDSQLGKTAEIQFKNRRELFKCLLPEVELVRYSSEIDEPTRAESSGGDSLSAWRQMLMLNLMLNSGVRFTNYESSDDECNYYGYDEYGYDEYGW